MNALSEALLALWRETVCRFRGHWGVSVITRAHVDDQGTLTRIAGYAYCARCDVILEEWGK